MNQISLPSANISKAEIEDFVTTTTALINDGQIDPLSAHVRAKAVIKALDAIIKLTEDYAIQESYKYSGKTFQAFGAELQIREGSEGPNLELDESYMTLKAAMKDREALLKQAYKLKDKVAIYDQATGEEVPVLPPKFTKGSISVSFR